MPAIYLVYQKALIFEQKARETLNYSIHTLELRKKLTQDEFRRLISSENSDIIYNNSNNDGVSVKKYYYTNDNLKNNGINITITQITGNQNQPFYKYYVSFRIDPNKTIGISSYYNIIQPEHIPKFIKCCRRILQDFGFIKKKLNELKLHRIDLCVNAVINTEASYYIAQAHRLPLPKGFSETYSKEKKEKCKYNANASFDKTNESRGISISLYDKIHAIPNEYQLSNIEEKYLLTLPHNCLRLEVRLSRQYIRTYNKMYNDNTEELIKHFADNSKTLIQKEAGKIFFRTGAIVTADIAKYYVSHQSYSSHKTSVMLDYISRIQKHYTFNAAYQKFCLEHSERRKRLLEYFYDIGISPIPIGINKNIKFLHSYGYIFDIFSVHQQFKEDRIQEEIRKKVM